MLEFVQLSFPGILATGLAIPPDATLRANFGIDQSESENGWNTIRFIKTIDDGEVTTLIDDTVTSDANKLWRQRRVNLGRFDSKRVSLCISTEIDGGFRDTQALAVWANPIIESKSQRTPRMRIARRLTERERELQKQQLEVLGYVD